MCDICQVRAPSTAPRIAFRTPPRSCSRSRDAPSALARARARPSPERRGERRPPVLFPRFGGFRFEAPAQTRSFQATTAERRPREARNRSARRSRPVALDSRTLPSRVLASPPSPPPQHLTQANPIYVVCHEDRAFLCRGCDFSIHSANEPASRHRRFVVSGAQVELHAVGGAGSGERTAAPANDGERTEEVRKKQSEKVRGKRKAGAGDDVALGGANHHRRDAYHSDDALVPSGNASGSHSGGAQGGPHIPDDEFNSFVADFVKGGAAADAEFLEHFFDDIPPGFQEDDLGVVPVM